jgi:hypothetical protein
MTIDEALKNVDDGLIPYTTARVLAAEVRRLRAAVERLADKDQTHHHVYGDDLWVKVTDVLRILEGE